MDLFVTGAFALSIGIIGILVAVFTKKPKIKWLVYALIGLVAGIPIGYLLTPFFISFM